MRATIIPTATVILILTFCISCSSGPSGPAPGTPAFYWSTAKDNFSTGDLLKANDNLDRALKSADYKAQGLPWSLVLTSGLARGYRELAEAYEKGGEAAKRGSGQFRVQMGQYRRHARVASLQFVEKFREFQTSNKDEQVKLVFPFPSGSPSEPPMLAKVTGGSMPEETIMDNIQKAMLQRALIYEASSAAGSPDDPTKAQAQFKAGEVSVPRTQFILAMANALYAQSEIFRPKKLDEPDKLRLFAETALDALKPVPQNKDVKTLNEKIQKSMKDGKSRAS
jgi:hypothetical protein